jgi:hypothetical protein
MAALRDVALCTLIYTDLRFRRASLAGEETSANTYQTSQWYLVDDSHLYTHLGENLKSERFFSYSLSYLRACVVDYLLYIILIN